MTTIVERDQSLVETFRSVVGTGAEALDTPESLTRHLETRPTEYAVVFGPSVDIETATDFAASMRIARPSLSVILVRKRVDTTVLTEALRSGMREVIEDRDLARLSEAVHRAYSLWQAMTNAGDQPAGSSRGKVFTVFSNKGGVGKSTVATNLATALVDEGKKRVCLVDLDVASGDVAIMLQLFPKSTLADLSALPNGIDPPSLESVLTPHSEGLSVLAAPMQPYAQEQVPAETAGQVLKILTTMFDIVVVDTSGAFDDFALQAFDYSDVVLLVGTLDVPALKSLKMATETLDLLNLPRDRWRLVLNRADSKVGLSPQEVEQTLKVDISTSIPSSRDVPACVNRGEAIVRVQPRHPVSQSIEQLARELLAAGSDQPVEAAAAPEPKRGGLFRKVVR